MFITSAPAVNFANILWVPFCHILSVKKIQTQSIRTENLRKKLFASKSKNIVQIGYVFLMHWHLSRKVSIKFFFLLRSLWNKKLLARQNFIHKKYHLYSTFNLFEIVITAYTQLIFLTQYCDKQIKRHFDIW